MKIIVTGATGMVGSEVIRQALADKEIQQITAIARKPLMVTDPKLKTVIHKDFLNYTGLEDVFRQHDACLWCLGISQNQVKEDEYVKITYDYAVAGAKAMLAAHAGMQWLFLSGDGASSAENSRLLFGRVKGRTENALLKMPFGKLHIARPAGILPVAKGDHAFVLRMQYLLVRIFKTVAPSYVIAADKLARALLHIVKHGAAQNILTYRDINAIARDL